MAMTIEQQRAMAMAEAAKRAAEALPGGQGGATPQPSGPARGLPPSPQGVPPVRPAGSPQLSGMGNLFGEGIARGAVSLAGLPASADEFLSDEARQYLPKAASDILASPKGGGLHALLPDITDVNQWLTGQEKKYGVDVAPPKTMGERFASAAGQGLGGAVAGGAGALGPVRTAISGIGGGIGGQAGAELFPNSKIAPIVGSLLGGGVGLAGAKPAAAAGSAVKSAVEPAAKLVEQTFSPTTVDASAREAEGVIRGHMGQAARDTAMTVDKLTPFRKQMTSLSEPERLNLTHYMETRSTGNAPAIPPELQGVANAARDAYQLRATKLSNLSAYQQRQFIADYFPHMWKDPKKAQGFVENFMRGGKEGSGKNLKERSIPTLADGIAAGLEPVTTDPVQATINYTANMDRFIATKQVFETAENNGLVKVVQAGQRPPSDWVKINTYVGKRGIGSDAYAPPGFARVYNNFVSKGFHGNETAGQWYDALQKVNGGVNALQLGLSAFHLATMSQEAVVNDVARGIGEAFSSPAKAIASIAKSPTAPVRLAVRGNQVLREYLNPGTSKNPLMKTITDLGTEANMNIATITKDLRASNAGSYWDALKRGTLRMELAADAKTAAGAPLTGTAKVFFKNMGRVLDTVAQPLFEKYIPRLKAGAFYDNMASWLEANPNALPEEQAKMARQMWDSIDNRFGEMNHDNIFWNQTLKQSARLALRSYSWKLGTAREIGGSLADVARNPKSLSVASEAFSPRAAYAIALPMTYGALMAAYQYMKTGQAPQDMHDLLAAKTGGKDAATGKPERIQMPSYMKDVFGWAEDPRQEVTNSLSPLVQTGKEMWTGQDWKGQPIADPNGSTPQWLGQWMSHIAQSYLPISVQGQLQGEKKGSNISRVEQGLGLRPANRMLTDPGGYEAMKRSIGASQWRKKQRSDARQKAQYKGIE